MYSGRNVAPVLHHVNLPVMRFLCGPANALGRRTVAHDSCPQRGLLSPVYVLCILNLYGAVEPLPPKVKITPIMKPKSYQSPLLLTL